MKRLLLATAAIASVAASPAYAADFILGQTAVVNSKFYVADATLTSVSAVLSNTPSTGTFSDRYFFAPTFLGVGDGQASVTRSSTVSLSVSASSVTAYALDAGLTALLGNAFINGAAATPGVFTALAAAMAGGPLATYNAQAAGTSGVQVNTVQLDPANFYVITLGGTSNGGAYSGTLDATSVPEPATWAMMLLGFGAVGFAMRRQGRAHPKVRFAF